MMQPRPLNKAKKKQSHKGWYRMIYTIQGLSKFVATQDLGASMKAQERIMPYYQMM